MTTSDAATAVGRKSAFDAVATYRGVDIGALMTRGAAAGLVGGFAFLIATMFFVVTQGLPAIAPLLDISTVFHASAKPVISPENMFVGLVTHLCLSIVFGLGFALLTPLLHRSRSLVTGAIVYGLALYVLNFQILGRTAFPWFTNPHGPNQTFEVLIHPLVFGLFLVPFFLPAGRTTRDQRVA